MRLRLTFSPSFLDAIQKQCNVQGVCGKAMRFFVVFLMVGTKVTLLFGSVQMKYMLQSSVSPNCNVQVSRSTRDELEPGYEIPLGIGRPLLNPGVHKPRARARGLAYSSSLLMGQAVR